MLDFSDLALDVGESARPPCPNCGGGTNEEKSFVVTRNSDCYVFVCHRASCGFSGAVRVGGGELLAARDRIKESVDKSSYPFQGEMYPASLSKMKAKFSVDFGFLPEPLHLSDDGRWMFPLREPRGQQWGWCARSYLRQHRNKKIILYYDYIPDIPFHFPMSINPFKDDRLVLVEDWVSAEKLASIGVSSCALLGTSLSVDNADKLRDIVGVRELVLCLDPDALAKSAKIRKQVGTSFWSVDIIALKADPKDTPIKELKEIFLGE